MRKMRTVQMTLDDELVDEVDLIVKKLKTSRSEFTRNALKGAIIRIKERELEKKHEKGYKNHPLKKGEFRVWDNEQCWWDESNAAR